MRTIAMLALVLLFLAAPALAQELSGQLHCGDRAEILAVLKKQYHEGPVFKGTTKTGDLFEMTLSPAGSWTAVMSSTTSGKSCFMSGGEYGVWEKLSPDGVPL